MSTVVAIMVVFPLIGLAGAAVALTSDLKGKEHVFGSFGAVAAIIGCYPGPMTFGVLGLACAIAGSILHLASRAEFGK